MDCMFGVPSRPLSLFTQMAIHILISFDWSQGVFCIDLQLNFAAVKNSPKTNINRGLPLIM